MSMVNIGSNASPLKKSFTPTSNISTADLHAHKVIYIVKIFLFALIAVLVMILKG